MTGRGPLRTRLEHFLERRNRASEKELGAYLLRVADVCDEVMRVGSLSSGQGAAIVEGVSHPGALVNVNCTEMIWAMQRQGLDVQPILTAMLRSPKVGVRHLAVCCVRHETSPEVTAVVLGAGLVDKGSTVRARAARQAQERGKTEMLPNVQAALVIEKNAKARETMEHAVKYMGKQLEARAEAKKGTGSR